VTWVEQLVALLKLPFLAVFKTFFTLLNLVPTKVYEIHAHPGHGTSNLARRALHTKIRGNRRVHLGTLLIAYVRGKVFKAKLNTNGSSCWGVFDEDLQEIQKVWIW